MSDSRSPLSNPSNDPAPLPWFEAEQAGKADASQTWRHAQESVALLSIQFRPSFGDRWRCHSRILWTRPHIVPTALLAVILWSTAQKAISYVFDSLRNGHLRSLTVWDLLTPLITAVALVGTAPLMQIVVTTKYMIKTGRVRSTPCSVTVTPVHVEYEMPDKVGKIKWKDVRGVVHRSGDIYLHGFALDSGVYIPRTAFADTDSAKRLHSALDALRLTRGNPEVVSAEARAEFPPPAVP